VHRSHNLILLTRPSCVDGKRICGRANGKLTEPSRLPGTDPFCTHLNYFRGRRPFVHNRRIRSSVASCSGRSWLSLTRNVLFFAKAMQIFGSELWTFLTRNAIFGCSLYHQGAVLCRLVRPQVDNAISAGRRGGMRGGLS